MRFHSNLPGLVWPAVPGKRAAALLSLQFQLDAAQWLKPALLDELQLHQLELLLRHSYATVPYYGERWRGLYDPGEPLTLERFSSLPLLKRGDLQNNFEALKSSAVPARHHPIAEARSSGSTGTPVRVLKTALTRIMWEAVLLREHIWHRRDLSGKLAAIRHGIKPGTGRDWGPPVRDYARTGPSARLPTSTSVTAQWSWLEEQQPDYLMTYPSNLTELSRLALARGVRLPGLREVRTVGEVVTPELRAMCREALGVPVVDAYSAQELGYLALQCPDVEHYHVQSETVLVEILDAEGRRCAPGQVGMVVVTVLHNFAMPLVRYALGDYAEVGESCGCGRALPVLRRILGRTRNMLVTPTGELYWPSFGSRKLTDIAAVHQHQFVQKELDLIEVRLVTTAPLTQSQEDGLREHILSRLPGPFRLKFAYCDEIPRSAGGKYEDFISELSAARA